MKLISEALEISRSHLSKSLANFEIAPSEKISQKVERKAELSDKEVIDRVKEITKSRPTYGYRRACAILNRQLKTENYKSINHKRVYRLMKESKLLLPKHSGFKPENKHEGKVITLHSNTRWCSDSLQIRCWDGKKIDMSFVMDTCDREILAYVATTGYLKSLDIQNMLVMAFERRFKNQIQSPRQLEWLTDNGGIFTAEETKNIARSLGFLPCQTPAYSPESNGMSESFVKRFKYDYIYVNELWDSAEVLKNIPMWLEDYNENHPHRGLGMKSPREFLRTVNAT